MKIRLQRFAYLDNGTFGTLTLPSGLVVYTVERPWLDNVPRVSCIPEGKYPLVPRFYFAGGYDAYEIRDVPGRTHILIHRGNWPTDFAGCVGVGRDLDLSEPAVWNSAPAFAKFMEEMDGRDAEIKISVRRAVL